MKNKFKPALLIILPVCLVFLSLLLRNTKGPYFLNIHYDPGYVYLINSLNFAQFSGYGTGFLDHPGIPLQLFGAFSVKICHLISGYNSDIALDVLARPDHYMNFINSALILLNSLILLFFGWSVYKLYNNVILAIFFQLTPFSAFNAFYELSDVSAENFLLMIYILFILTALRYSENLKKGKPDKQFLYLIAFSVLTGIGIANKLNFAPFIFIPLMLLNKNSLKLSYLIISFILFLICIYPGFNNIKGISDWFISIISNNGIYSNSNFEAYGSPDYIMNLMKIFSEDIFFAIVFFLILILFLFNIFRSPAKGISRFENVMDFYLNNKILTAVFIIMNLEFLLLLKKFSHHYIFPSLILSVTGLILCIQNVYREFPLFAAKMRLQSAYLAVIILIVSFQFFNYRDHFIKYDLERIEALKLNEFIENNFPAAVLISGYGSSNEIYSKNYLTYWSGSQTGRYKNILHKEYPDNLFYEYWSTNIFGFSESSELTDIKELMLSGNQLLFQTNNMSNAESLVKNLREVYGLNVTGIKKIYENSCGELVYQINIVS
ncbi:MAG TPA: hypothetical protein PKD83_14160 [Ignavibacteria bacterium]|nr:hypothetical protein [Ignavibacteria bacterium]